MQTSNITLYINALTGEDFPGKGLSVDQPFKTISYALGRIPSLRETSDVYALLIIAPGTYNEAVAIDLKNIWLMGSGIDSTQIVGQAGNNTISVNGESKIGISGITVLDGDYGVYLVAGAAVRLRAFLKIRRFWKKLRSGDSVECLKPIIRMACQNSCQCSSAPTEE